MIYAVLYNYDQVAIIDNYIIYIASDDMIAFNFVLYTTSVYFIVPYVFNAVFGAKLCTVDGGVR